MVYHQIDEKGAYSALFRLPSSVIYVGVNSLDGKSKEERSLHPFDQFGFQTEDKGAPSALSSCLGLRSFTFW